MSDTLIVGYIVTSSAYFPVEYDTTTGTYSCQIRGTEWPDTEFNMPSIRALRAILPQGMEFLPTSSAIPAGILNLRDWLKALAVLIVILLAIRFIGRLLW